MSAEEELAVYAPIEFEPAHWISDEEIEELSVRNPALCFERTPEGALIVSPPMGFDGSIRNGELFGQILAWNKHTKLGYVTESSGGYSMPTKALYAPDTAWTSKARIDALSKEEREKFAPLSPDVAFELRSQSDSPIRLLRKLRHYIDAGSTLAVLVDPYRRTVTAIFAGEEPRTFENPETLRFVSASGVEPMPGFALDLREIFAAN